ncbi:MAG: helix-turn-helix domain-containing protein [Actinomycetota bacterium]|nr:helix-turn-helix domain-containing protein [Actinomycetota bacterium]
MRITEPKQRSPGYLSGQERIVIADLLVAGVTVRGIARELRRAALTISGEIARNGDLDGRYWPDHAKHAARARAGQPRQRRIGLDGVLALTVAPAAGQALQP